MKLEHSRILLIIVMLMMIFGVLGVVPAQAAPAGLAPADWAQIKAMLPPSQQAYLKTSNTEGADIFGSSVAISNNTVVVAAPYEDSSATGVNGNGADNSATTAGAAYVFTRSGTTWSQQAYLKASNAEGGDIFGSSVAIFGDTIVVGAVDEDSSATGVNGNQADNSATNAGAAYVFTRIGATWSQQAYLKASNTNAGDNFGYSVAIFSDTIVVGAIYESSSATGVNGDQADNTATGAGAVYVFTRSGTTWSQQAYLKASNTDGADHFGDPVAISGNTVVVGAVNEASSATGVNGNEADNTAVGAGAVYVFTRSGTTWSQQAYLKASNTEGADIFGSSLAISTDTIVVGAPYEDSSATGVNGNEADNSATIAGAAYVFTRSGTIWSQQAYLKASNTNAGDIFGWSVGVSGDTIVVGAPNEASSATGVNGNQADNSATTSGAAYVFTRSGTIWSQQAYVKASNTDGADNFGWSVAISGGTAVVGAPYEDSSATGVNGNEADDTATSAGAAYVFVAVTPNTPTPTLTATRTRTKTPTRTPTRTATVSSAPVKVVLNQATGQTDPTTTRLLRFTVAFSEAVSGFTAADVKLTLSEPCSPSVAITGSGKVYSISLTNMTIECTATVSIPAGKVNSVSRPGITNSASTSTDNSQQFLYAVKTYYSPAASDGWILESV